MKRSIFAALACAFLVLTSFASSAQSSASIADAAKWRAVVNVKSGPATVLAQAPATTTTVPVAMVPVVEAPRTGGVISLGPIFGWLSPYVDAVINGLIAVAFGWLAFYLKQKWNVEIDANHMHSIQTWAMNQASALIAQGHARLVEGSKFAVSSPALAAAANSVLVRIPEAAAHFGLTPEKARDIIFDKLAQVPPMTGTAAAAVKPTTGRPA